MRKQGVGVNSIVQQTQEFSIQNEDFPALPGFKGVLAITKSKCCFIFFEILLILYLLANHYQFYVLV